MVPAWLELDDRPGLGARRRGPPSAAGLRGGVTRRSCIERAQLLGLPVARVGEAPDGGPRTRRVVAHRLGEAPPRPDVDGVVVVDLSALWAGPLCGDLLARAGATVVKVESTQRPDGARRGTRAFFDLLNGRKRSVALDLQSRQGIRILHALVRRADIVIEASRPRALAQFGLDAPEVVARRRPPGLDLHHRLRPLRRGRQPRRVRRRRRRGGRPRGLDRGRPAVLRRRRRRPAHRPHGRRRLPRHAPLGRTLAPRCVHGRRERRSSPDRPCRLPAGLTVAEPQRAPGDGSRRRSSEPTRHASSPSSGSTADGTPSASRLGPISTRSY